MSEPKINYLGPACEADIGESRMNTQWKLVPVEPTREMLVASLKTNGACPIYAAMLAAAPAPPAGGEVEVIGWQCNGYQFGSKENADSYWRWMETPKPIIELVDRAHVTRLTAERDALQQLLNAADQRIDDLLAELATVRQGPCKMIIGDELP